jgi:hypothetical protein
MPQCAARRGRKPDRPARKMDWRRLMLRIAIIALAALELISFFWLGYMAIQWDILLHPFKEHTISYDSALFNAVIAPLSALVAIALVTMSWRPWIALALLGVTFLLYYGPIIPFAIGVMIFGA